MGLVLLLEDDQRFVRAVKRALAKHEVLDASAVDQAIAILDEREVDCALVDLNLTDFDDNSGAELLAYMKRNTPHVPRAVVTGSRLRGGIYSNLMSRYGVAEVVIKGAFERSGFGTTDLLTVVETMLEAGPEANRGALCERVKSEASDRKSALKERLSSLEAAREVMPFSFRSKGRRRAELFARIEKIESLEELALSSLATAPRGELEGIYADFIAKLQGVDCD